jgi:hypothetical protein
VSDETVDNEGVKALGEQVAEALAPTEMRLKIEALQARNDEILQRMTAQKIFQMSTADVANVRLAILVELLLGDMDTPNRLVYEGRVQARFSELLAGVEQQAARATLLNGVRLDPRNQPPPGR